MSEFVYNRNNPKDKVLDANKVLIKLKKTF